MGTLEMALQATMQNTLTNALQLPGKHPNSLVLKPPHCLWRWIFIPPSPNYDTPSPVSHSVMTSLSAKRMEPISRAPLSSSCADGSNWQTSGPSSSFTTTRPLHIEMKRQKLRNHNRLTHAANMRQKHGQERLTTGQKSLACVHAHVTSHFRTIMIILR